MAAAAGRSDGRSATPAAVESPVPAAPVPSVTERLAAWAVGLGDRGLPADVSEVTAHRLLDYLANVLGGADQPSVARLVRFASRHPGDVPLPGGSSTWPDHAALVYGAAAHAIESDDTHQPSSSHPGAVVFSTVLPLALAGNAEWPSVAAATVVGYEVMGRIGEASRPAGEYARGFHPTGTVGAFAAAAAAGVLGGADADQLSDAMGIAGSFSSGSMSYLTNGSWTKHLHPGWAAHGGLLAAALAADGYAAPRRVLERPHGYFAGHSDAPDPATALTSLGSRPYVIERTSLKAHGCCRYEQAAIDGILELRRRHGVVAEDVAAVRVGVLAAGWDIIAAPAERKRRPANAVDAQFSMPFGAAVALVYGRASRHEHTEAHVRDPAVISMMDRVECFLDPSLDEAFPARWPAIVELRLRDGRELSIRVEYPKGDPENPLSLEEVADKLHQVAPAVDERARGDVIEAVRDLPRTGNVARVGDALAAAWGR
ncbi:MAG TPA: MmgE/PrpD family protein [Actinomycetota bacterium]|nr:MmgE/PrpD family protein [Actinomycetota bacterium]